MSFFLKPLRQIIILGLIVPNLNWAAESASKPLPHTHITLSSQKQKAVINKSKWLYNVELKRAARDNLIGEASKKRPVVVQDSTAMACIHFVNTEKFTAEFDADIATHTALMPLQITDEDLPEVGIEAIGATAIMQSKLLKQNMDQISTIAAIIGGSPLLKQTHHEFKALKLILDQACGIPSAPVVVEHDVTAPAEPDGLRAVKIYQHRYKRLMPLPFDASSAEKISWSHASKLGDKSPSAKIKKFQLSGVHTQLFGVAAGHFSNHVVPSDANCYGANCEAFDGECMILPSGCRPDMAAWGADTPVVDLALESYAEKLKILGDVVLLKANLNHLLKSKKPDMLLRLRESDNLKKLQTKLHAIDFGLEKGGSVNAAGGAGYEDL